MIEIVEIAESRLLDVESVIVRLGFRITRHSSLVTLFNSSGISGSPFNTL